jgi:hypothetical protein
MEITIEVLSSNSNALEQIKMAFNRRNGHDTIPNIMNDIGEELGYEVANTDDKYSFTDKE